MRRLATTFFVTLIIVTIASQAFAAETSEERTPLQGLDRVESIVYGAPLTGGLLLRLSKIERDLFGMELPGSLTERQEALRIFVEEGNENQPSFTFKLGVAEWVTLRYVSPLNSFEERITNLEKTLENETQQGALSARLERILTKLLPSGVSPTPIQIPASTVFRAKFVNTLTVRTVEKGDIIPLELDEDCVINGTLAAAKGNRVFAEITKVKMPRSFGRPSEIGVEFLDVESIGGIQMPVLIGPEAKKAMELDSGAVGAAGASIMGAVLVGPVGLAGGFLVRGSDKQIPAGTMVYVETEDSTEVAGYQITGLPETPQTTTEAGFTDSTSQPPSDTFETINY